MAAPGKIDAYNRLQFNINGAHNVLKLGLESILIHLQKPPVDDLPNFLGYSRTWAKILDGHHETEEVMLFPFLSEKLDMSGEIEQHKIIHACLEKLFAFIGAAQADPSQFDAVKMGAILTTLKDPLFQHLDEEIEHLAPDNLRAFDAKELDAMFDKLVHYAHTHDSPFVVLPFMLRHTPDDVKPTWPEMPWILKKVATPYIFHWKYSGYWKYCPYDY